MKSLFRSRWLWVAAGVVILAQAVAAALIVTDILQGPAQNLGAQILIGGVTALVLLGLGAMRYGEPGFPKAAPQVAILGVTGVAAIGVALYAWRVTPFVQLPVDLAGWSEPMFLLDIIKWRTGATLYGPIGDSNSNPYTFGAPMVSYALATLLGRSDSIFVYRLLHQMYLVLAALVMGWSSWRLIGVADPGGRPSRLWLGLFVCVSFLLATNDRTNFFVTYLHNDPLALLTTAIAFWLMVEHARSKRTFWLVAMAVLPAAAFVIKQYLVLWAFAYLVYLWLDGTQPWRRLFVFATTSFGLLGATLAACYVAWGDPFRYWVFEVLGVQVVSFMRITHLFSDAALFLLPGGLAAGMLIDRSSRDRLLGIWAAWPILVLGATYSTGITFHPTHLGPATLVGGGLFLTALARFWPDGRSATTDAWPRLAAGVLLPLMLFVAWRTLVPRQVPISPDLYRYVQQIEDEFGGLPPEKVLVDTGEWIYLRHGIVARDRLSIQQCHPERVDDFMQRVREHAYGRILVRRVAPDTFSFENDVYRGVTAEMLRYYREVRRIPAVRGMERWNYRAMTLPEIAVLEPINAVTTADASATRQR